MEKTITLSQKEYEDLKATEASNQKIIEELQARIKKTINEIRDKNEDVKAIADLKKENEKILDSALELKRELLYYSSKATQLYEMNKELSVQSTLMELHIQAIKSTQLYEMNKELSVQVTIMELHIKALKSRNLWQRIFNTPVSLTVLNNALKLK